MPFNILSNGGVIINPIQEVPWSKCCATVIDKLECAGGLQFDKANEHYQKLFYFVIFIYCVT